MNEMSSYGNISWQVFVYVTYLVVTLFLAFYVYFSMKTRKNALKNLTQEGFLEQSTQVQEELVPPKT